MRSGTCSRQPSLYSNASPGAETTVWKHERSLCPDLNFVDGADSLGRPCKPGAARGLAIWGLQYRSNLFMDNLLTM